MKVLSLKLDDKIFGETEKLTEKMKIPRNRYINDAVNLYNLYNHRRLLKKQFAREARLGAGESLAILHEFESLLDEDQSI